MGRIAVQHTENGSAQHIAHQTVIILIPVMFRMGDSVVTDIDCIVVQMGHCQQHLTVMMMRYDQVGEYHNTRQQHHHYGHKPSHFYKVTIK